VASNLPAAVNAALSKIRHPRLDNDLLSSGTVRDLSVSDGGEVRFTFLLGREDPATLVRQARLAIRDLPGVAGVHIDVVDPGAQAAPAGTRPAARPGPGGAPPEAPAARENLGQVLAISSGKGGVGKSTVAANLAVTLAAAGLRVGLMDADVYGPNIPRMFGVSEKPRVVGGRIQPLEAAGVRLMSLGLLVERDAPAIWRGPIIMKIVHQFLNDVDWGELDYFLVDLPPGTGDAQLSLAQAIRVSGALIITTPQEVAVGDALRGAKMFERVNVPVIGIVENMSGFICPHCGERTDVFRSGGGQRLAEETEVPLLVQIPLQPGMADQGDEGKPVVLSQPESPAAIAFRELAEAVRKALRGKPVPLPILRG